MFNTAPAGLLVNYRRGSLNNLSFRALVPWLLLLATVIFAAGPWLKPKPQPEGEPEGRRLFGKAVQLVVSVYGGFFGAGMGIMMLASLGITRAATITASTLSKTSCRLLSPRSQSLYSRWAG